MKQQQSSPLQPDDVKKLLKDAAHKRFVDATRNKNIDPEKICEREKFCSSSSLFGFELHFCIVKHIT